jgi:hypothetical protein
MSAQLLLLIEWQIRKDEILSHVLEAFLRVHEKSLSIAER